MRRLFFLALPLFLVLNSCNQNDQNIHLDKTGKRGYEVKIKIPTEWIEKLRGFDYTRNTTTLLHEFESFIKPDTIGSFNHNHVDPDYGRVINPLFVNLDSEPGDEMICVLGWEVRQPYMCVFKQESGSWYLIYMEQFRVFSEEPTVYVANNFSRNKTFYYKSMEGEGSGVYWGNCTFYKLIDNKVYQCLRLVNRAESFGAAPYLSYELKSDFEFSGDEDDSMGVDYSYKFESTTNLVDYEGNLHYEWNNKKHIYQPKFDTTPGLYNQITPTQLKCLDDMDNDTLFVAGFRSQINEVLKTGTSLQKKILSMYLKKDTAWINKQKKSAK